RQKPRPPVLLPEYPVPAATTTKGMYVAGTITTLGSGSLTVQVTSTGPRDTGLQGQTLTVAIVPATTILIAGQPGAAGQLQTGEAVSLRIVKTSGGYSANEISA